MTAWRDKGVRDIRSPGKKKARGRERRCLAGWCVLGNEAASTCLGCVLRARNVGASGVLVCVRVGNE